MKDLKLPPLPDPHDSRERGEQNRMKEYACAAIKPYLQRIQKLESQLAAIVSGGLSVQRVQSQRSGGRPEITDRSPAYLDSTPDLAAIEDEYERGYAIGQRDCREYFEELLNDRQRWGEPYAYIYDATVYFVDPDDDIQHAEHILKKGTAVYLAPQPAEPATIQERRDKLRADPDKAEALDRAQERIERKVAGNAEQVVWPADILLAAEMALEDAEGDEIPTVEIHASRIVGLSFHQQPAEPEQVPVDVKEIAQHVLMALRAEDHGDLLRASDYGPLASIERALRAHYGQPTIPEAWQIVPKVQTNKMMSVTLSGTPDTWTDGEISMERGKWDAYLAAAPKFGEEG